MNKLFLLLFLTIGFAAKSQSPVLIGYWQNWDDVNAPYIHLDQVDPRYNVICVAFVLPVSSSDMHMQFTPDGISQGTFISKMQTLQAQGRKVLLSIGGETGFISLNNNSNRDAFISTLGAILNTYHFDGIDIDIENGNSILASGTIANPTSPDCINLIYALNAIKTNYENTFSNSMMLTFAPETAFVQGGMSAYGGIWGGYLPVIDALRDAISYVQVQLYNSGTMYGIDGNIYSQGTEDFIIAMSEALIQGFNTAGGMFQGLPSNKVLVGLPACPSAAGGGFITTARVASAIKYLKGTGPRPGSYTLYQPAGYVNIGGMMTWSINWDKVITCNPASYEFAQNYLQLFSVAVPVTLVDFTAKLFNHSAIIVWKTINEINLNYYEVQHSTDGIIFYTIANKPALNMGYSRSYEFTHDNIPGGYNYYRLKITGVSGSRYSSVMLVNNVPEASFIIVPNPVSAVMFVKGNIEAGSDYQIINMQGQVITLGKLPESKSVSVSELPKGSYLFRCNRGVKRFTKL